MPTMAPAIAPERETVLALWPSHAVSTLTPSAHGAAATRAGRVEANDDASIRLASQSTAAADTGTEMLSSRRTGIVSTNAATIAAASVAAIVNDTGGTGSTAGRVHSASATPPNPPKTKKATVPATLLSGHQGSRPCPRLTAEDAKSAERSFFSTFSTLSGV